MFPDGKDIFVIELIQHVAMAKLSAIANGDGVRLRYRKS